MYTAEELTQSVYNGIKELGASESEARLYTASVRLGPVSISKLAVELKWSRPKLYTAIRELERRGLADLKDRRKFSRSFVVSSPSLLIDRLRLKMESVSKTEDAVMGILPNLLASYQQGENLPLVRMIEGRRNLRDYIDRIYNVAKYDISFFGCGAEVIGLMSHAFEVVAEEFRSGKKIKARALLVANQENAALKELYSGPGLQVKLLHKDMTFTSSFHISAHTVVFWQIATPLAIAVDDQHITMMMQSIFDKLWEKAS